MGCCFRKSKSHGWTNDTQGKGMIHYALKGRDRKATQANMAF